MNKTIQISFITFFFTIFLIFFSTSCKKEEDRGLITLNEFSKKFITVRDTLEFQYHNHIQRYKLAIYSQYYEEIEIESDSKYHTINASIEHIYKKFTSPDYYLIYHMYVSAYKNSHKDLLKITVIDKRTEASQEINITMYEENLQGNHLILQPSDSLSLGAPLIKNTYYTDFEDYRIFLLDSIGILNYQFEKKVWLHVFK